MIDCVSLSREALLPQWEDLWNSYLCISMSTHGKQVAPYFALTGFVECSLQLVQILVKNTNENIFKRCSSVGSSVLDAIFSDSSIFWCIDCRIRYREPCVGEAFKCTSVVHTCWAVDLKNPAPGQHLPLDVPGWKYKAHFAKHLSPSSQSSWVLSPSTSCVPWPPYAQSQSPSPLKFCCLSPQKSCLKSTVWQCHPVCTCHCTFGHRGRACQLPPTEVHSTPTVVPSE